jgi:DNA-binding CsgD family transcriptional regulator
MEISSDRLLFHLGELFSRGLNLAAFRLRAAKLLRELAQCPVVSFAHLNPATRELSVDFDPKVPGIDAGMPGFGTHMAKYPCFNFDPAVNDGVAFLRGDFLSDAEFYASPIYLEGFALAGITDHAAIQLPVTREGVPWIGLELMGGVFQPWQRELIVRLQPHLGNAWLLALDGDGLKREELNAEAMVSVGLTPRQAQTLALVGAGKSNGEIAVILGLSLNTVKDYVSVAFDKLGVDNRHAALLRAHEICRQHGQPPPNPGVGHASAFAAPAPSEG